MGPIDYSLNIANPLQSVLQGFQLGQQIRQQRMQEQQAQEQAMAAQQKAQAMASLMRPGVEFADYQRVMQAFPEETKGLLDQWNAMDKMNRDTMFNAGGEAYALLRPNAEGVIDPTASIAKLEQYATASEANGDTEAAKKFRDMAAYVKTNPEAGKATIGSVLSVWDSDRAKGVLAAELGPLDTSTVKDLIAEGLTPGTPEFRAALTEKRRRITVTLPGNGFFSGSPEELQQVLGGPPPAGAQRGDLPRPKTKAEFDALPPGAVFVDPDGKMRTKPGAPPGAEPIIVGKQDAAALRKSMGEARFQAWLKERGLVEER